MGAAQNIISFPEARRDLTLFLVQDQETIKDVISKLFGYSLFEFEKFSRRNDLTCMEVLAVRIISKIFQGDIKFFDLILDLFLGPVE